MSLTNVVLVLANLMDENANLNAETKARVELGCREARAINARFVMFIGWNYREDCPTPIAQAMRDYALENNLIDADLCLINTLSRDTVGDAILSRAHLSALLDDLQLTVATSDYHTERTRHIFEKVFGKQILKSVIGAATPPLDRASAENKSIVAFETTFKNVDFKNFEDVLQCLLEFHPFYNGTAMPSRPFPKPQLAKLAEKPIRDC